MTLAVQLLLSGAALIAEAVLLQAILGWEDRSIKEQVAALVRVKTRSAT